MRVLLVNTDREATATIRRGDRIAQLVVQSVVHARFVPVAELNETQRGDGGFGSTGGHGAAGKGE